MQIDKKDYNENEHDIYRALSVKQPYADLLTKAVMIDAEGRYHAEKTIEVRSRNTSFRGDVLICSSKIPDIPLHPSGVTCGFVELYCVKPVSEFTEDDWAETCIPPADRPKDGFGWLMRNPRRVVEMPVKGKLGFYDIIVPKGDITEYPRAVKFGKDGFDAIRKEVSKKLKEENKK